MVRIPSPLPPEQREVDRVSRFLALEVRGREKMLRAAKAQDSMGAWPR